ncbi:uncharacterized protein Tco025E_03230 [Trypanosoma conorhini]|uniref:Uncharacterized protein n=1 Tax=Trypanosoma conorhini TaxID=83891 RepID=A0A422PW01_9TRYP|nr:uncharacterized protein Tco025E_03230 [Trypanosoma conorhini]RNF21900.1 hypothetical protein Tco025E_03230 [Trypanosoma conorhini]
MMVLILAVLLLSSTALAGGVAVTPCAHCAADPAKVWCPEDMSCHAAGNCTCGTSCLDLVDCFVQETTCARCVGSGGTFCTRPAKGHRPCFFAVGAARHASAAAHEEQCSEVCLEGGRCLSRLDKCPKRPVDPVMFSWFIVNVAVAVAIAVFVVIVLYAGMARAKADVAASPTEHG